MMFNLEETKRKLLVKYPFFGSVIANVNYMEEADLKTAATDGRTIYYNPTFLNSLSNEEQLFVIAHEVCHIAFNHINRAKDHIPDLWNIATDAVINVFLKKDGLKMIDGGVDIKDAINYDAEQLYQKLKQNAKVVNIEVAVCVKNHKKWTEGKKSISNNSNIDKIIEKIQKEFSAEGEGETFEKNRKKRQEIFDKKKEELSNSLNKFPENNPSSSIRNINNIGNSNPLLDIRYLLRESITYEVDWSYKNADIDNGVLCPRLEERPFNETEIVLDTSGSIDDELLKAFLREIRGILYYSKLKVGCFDTRFYGFNEIRDLNDIENMEFPGGGGTNFSVAVDAFTEQTPNHIVFTDGYAYDPEKTIDVIWIVFGNKNFKPKYGKVIYISLEELRKKILPNCLVKVKKR